MADIKLRLKLEDIGDLNILKPINKQFDDIDKSTDDIADNMRDIKQINLRQYMLDLNRAMGQGARVVTDIVKNLGSMSVEAAKSARELSILAQTVGLTVGEMDALGDSAELAGMSMSDVQTLMSKLSTGVTDVDGKLTSAGKAMASLGVQAQGANGEVREAGVLFKETLDAILKLDDNAKKVDIFGEIFGKRNTRYITDLIGRGVSDFAGIGVGSTILNENDYKVLTKYAEEVRNLGDVLDDIRKKSSSQFAGLFTDSLTGFTKMLDDLVSKYPFLAGVISIGGAAADKIPELVQVIADLRIALSGLSATKFAAASGSGDLVGSALGGAGFVAASGSLAKILDNLDKAEDKSLDLDMLIDNLIGERGINIGPSQSPFEALIKGLDKSEAALKREIISRQKSIQSEIVKGIIDRDLAEISKELSREIDLTKTNMQRLFPTVTGFRDKLRESYLALVTFIRGINLASIRQAFSKESITGILTKSFSGGWLAVAAAAGLAIGEGINKLFRGETAFGVATEAKTLGAENLASARSQIQNEIARSGKVEVTFGDNAPITIETIEEFDKALKKQAQTFRSWGDNAAEVLDTMTIKVKELSAEESAYFQNLVKQASDAGLELSLSSQEIEELDKSIADIPRSALATFDAANGELNDFLKGNEAINETLNKRSVEEKKQQELIETQLKAYKEQVRFIEEKRAKGVEISNEELQAARDRVYGAEKELELIQKKREELEKTLKLRILDIALAKNAQTIEEAGIIENMSQEGITKITKYNPQTKKFQAEARQIELQFQRDLIEGGITQEEAVRKRHIAMFELKLKSFKENVERLKSLSQATLNNIDAKIEYATAIGDQALVDKLREQRDAIRHELIARQAEIASLGDPVELQTLNTMKMAEALKDLEESLDKISSHYQKIAETNREIAESWRKQADRLKAFQENRNVRNRTPDAVDPALLTKENKAREEAWKKDLEAAQAEYDLVKKTVAERQKANKGVMTQQMRDDMASAGRKLSQAQDAIATQRLQANTEAWREAIDRATESVQTHVDALSLMQDFYNTRAAGYDMDTKEGIQKSYEDQKKALELRKQEILEAYRMARVDSDRMNDMEAMQEAQTALMQLRQDEADLEEQRTNDLRELTLDSMDKQIEYAKALYAYAIAANLPLEQRKKILEDIENLEKSKVKELEAQGKATEALTLKTEMLNRKKEEANKLTFGQELLLASGGSRGGIQEFLNTRFGSNSVSMETFKKSPEDIKQIQQDLSKSIVDMLSEALSSDTSVVSSGAVDKLRETLQTTILKTIEEVFKR